MTTGFSRSRILLLLIVCAGISLLPASSPGQVVTPQTMTRSKMWIKANPNGSFERENNLGLSGHDWELAYPGYFDNRNEACGGFDNNAIYNGAQVGGDDVGWMYRNNFNTTNIYSIVTSALTKNYNLINPNAAEEQVQGTIGSPKFDASGRRHMSYRLQGTIRAWSLPKYDDFIIIKCTLTNTDTDTLKNYYYARYVTPNGPYSPSSVSSGWDKEYLWDPAVSDTIGFIFYDDTSIPPTTSRPVYTISPGDSTGNAGDPGNIGRQGSRDFKLYAPSLYAYSFLPSQVTPNKNGERKVWRTVVSSSSTAPDAEKMPSWNSEMQNYPTMVDFIRNKPQPKISWRAAYDSIQRGGSVIGAGSLWERNPRYVYAIGPYDIPPNGSIDWVEIFLCGQMDRNVTMRGGLTATRQFVGQGLLNLKENWAAARALIASNYRMPASQVPPPTPADAPRVGNTNELVVVPGEAVAGGKRIAGVQVKWKAVHALTSVYIPPSGRRRDFATYRIYQSDNSIEGPWALVDSVPRAKADSLRRSSKDTTTITYFIKSSPGVPYRYCVTSVDSLGNESGMTGYNYYPVASEPDPSNNLQGIVVVPNPFRQVSGYSDQSENKRLAFVNIPWKCTIRIYTVALDLVRVLEHEGAGLQSWGSQVNQDYMLTDFGQNVMPGIYIYHVESHVPGQEGKTTVGKFAIIR